jgi:hypothetical protein
MSIKQRIGAVASADEHALLRSMRETGAAVAADAVSRKIELLCDESVSGLIILF